MNIVYKLLITGVFIHCVFFHHSHAMDDKEVIGKFRKVDGWSDDRFLQPATSFYYNDECIKEVMGTIDSIVFSPDGSAIAFVCEERYIACESGSSRGGSYFKEKESKDICLYVITTDKNVFIIDDFDKRNVIKGLTNDGHYLLAEYEAYQRKDLYLYQIFSTESDDLCGPWKRKIDSAKSYEYFWKYYLCLREEYPDLYKINVDNQDNNLFKVYKDENYEDEIKFVCSDYFKDFDRAECFQLSYEV